MSKPDFHLMPLAPAADRLLSVLPSTAAETRTTDPVQIELHSEMEPLQQKWRRLEADNLNSLHQSFDWCLSWARTHNNPLAIVEGIRDGRTVFILPLEIVRHNMIRTAQFIGSRFSNINTGLFDPDFRELCASTGFALSKALISALQGKADLVSLRNIPLDWRGRRSPFASLPLIEHQNHAFQLPLFADFDTTIDQLSGKRRRKKFRAQLRKLEAAGGYEHVIARSDTEKSRMIDLFFRQKAVRFKALGLPNTFHAPETQAFFRMLLERSGDGQDVALELHGLRLKGEYEGQIAAIAGLSRNGDHVICQFGSIDETLVPGSGPGEFLFWLIIEKCCSEGAAIFDFGLGDQEYKRRWCTIETVQHDVLLPISAPGRLAAFVQRGVTHAKAAIKSNAQLYAAIQRLRAYADEGPATKAAGTDG